LTTGREQTRRDADEQIEKNMRILKLAREDQGWALSRILLAERLEAERPALLAELEQAKRQRDKALKRLHLILSSVIYSTHGFLDADGEIDTAAKFRAIERLARIDWDEEGMPR
jgi:hypothetical protein